MFRLFRRKKSNDQTAADAAEAPASAAPETTLDPAVGGSQADTTTEPAPESPADTGAEAPRDPGAPASSPRR